MVQLSGSTTRRQADDRHRKNSINPKQQMQASDASRATAA
jgi:hypothetical protein